MANSTDPLSTQRIDHDPSALSTQEPEPEETQGQRIRRIRTDKGLEQKWVALKAEITPGYLTAVEMDRKNPSDEVLRKLAYAMKIAPSLLRVHPPAPKGLTLDITIDDAEALAAFINAPVSDEVLEWCRTMLRMVRDGRELRRLDRPRSQSE